MKNWKSTLVARGTAIRKVIEIIDRGSMQIALVVGPNNHLLGTVTDGDVRRGILKGISLDEAVEHIMRENPSFAFMTDAKENMLTLMKKKEIHQLPILNSQGCVVGMEILGEIVAARDRDNFVVLMAGGLGSRLRPLTKDTPKPLLPV